MRPLPLHNMTSTPSVEDFLGYPLTTQDLDSLADEIVAGVRSAQAARGQWLACLNPHSYVMALDEAPFHAALHRARWLIPDGVGVVIGSRLLGGKIRSRVCGPDAFLAVSRRMNAGGPFKAMFIGATEDTLAIVERRYRSDFPQASEVVTYSPPFRAQFSAEDIAAMRALIERHQPDVLWMGLSAPKQEVLLAQLAQGGQFGFAAAIGAAFDFYAGKVVRSPMIFQRLGLEWLPRLLQQPRRLWRRMFVSAPIFVGHVLATRLRGTRSTR